MKQRPPRLIQARLDDRPLMVKCKCRRIVVVPAEGVTCACGQRFRVADSRRSLT